MVAVGTKVKLFGHLVGVVVAVAKNGKRLHVDTGSKLYWAATKNVTVVA